MPRWLEHRIPPPVIDAACALVMWLLARSLPQAQCWPQGAWPAVVAALLLAGLGGMVALAGLHAFRSARTTMNPLAPRSARVLVTGGIYRHTRNPMYLGMLLVLAGWGAWLGNAAAWLGLPLSIWLITALQIRPEERILAERFGDGYLRYAARVRRWL